MSSASASSAVGVLGIPADLLADMDEAKADVRKAKAALERAEDERARGTRDEVSACRQTLNNMTAILNLLYEKEKRLTAGTGEARRSGPIVICFTFYLFLHYLLETFALLPQQGRRSGEALQIKIHLKISFVVVVMTLHTVKFVTTISLKVLA